MTLSLGKKVQLLLVLAIAFVAIMGTTGLLVTSSLGEVVDDFVGDKVPTLQALSQLSTAVGRAAGSASAVENGSLQKTVHDAALEMVAQQLKLASEAATALDRAGSHRAEKGARLDEAIKAWRGHFDAFAAAARDRDNAGEHFAEAAAKQSVVSEQFEALRADSQALLETIDTVVTATQASAVALEERARTSELRAKWGTIVSFLVAGGVLAAMGFLLLRGVTRSLSGLQAQAREIEAAVEAGRLDFRAEVEGLDSEFRPVVQGMNGIMGAYHAPISVTADYVSRISKGDIPPLITDAYRGDFNQIKDSLNRCVRTLDGLVRETDLLSRAAVEGRLSERADATRQEGVFRRLVEGQNRTIATLVGHLDAMPAPAMVIGRDFAVRYMNQAGTQLLGRKAAEVVGQRCSDLFKTGDCQTEKCACARAMQTGRMASSETQARPGDGSSYDIAYSGVPVRDERGDVIGAFEVIADQTSVQAAMRAARQLAAYQDEETRKVTAALGCLASGELGFRLDVGAGSAETVQARETFARVAAAIEQSREAVRGLATDAAALAQAAVEGRLATRADAGRHQGEYRMVIEGVNRTLDAIIAPVNEAAVVLEKLADKDLRARVTGQYLGDHAKIKSSVNAAGEALHDALAQVAEAVEQVSSASTQIAASSQAVASGASEQAASLEQTTTSLESVLTITGQASDSAQQANALARTASAAATDGAAAVEQMQGAMGKIRASAESTSQIIKDINDIAFQTNLLALNAAVEAARAGEAGRGFAVVAEEVRSLALRAKEAATKTEGLIRESVREAGEGEATSKQVATKLGEIVSGIGKVSEIVSEIAAAAKEQSAGIGQVSTAVGEMDKVTQQNAASAEEASSAASELSGQAEELAAMVGTFQMARAGAAAAPRRGAPPYPPTRQQRAS